MAGNHRRHKMEAATTISRGRLAARKQGNCADDVCQGRTGRSLQKQTNKCCLTSRACREHLEMPAARQQRSWGPARPGKCSGFVCRCCYFQQKLSARHPHFISSSHLSHRWRATVTFHGWRNPNLLPKPGCFVVCLVGFLKATELKTLHKNKQALSFLKKKKRPRGQGQADEEGVTPP